MKKLLFLLLVVTSQQLQAQSLRLSQSTISEFSKAVQAKYKTSAVFKAGLDSMLQARYPDLKPLTVLRTMDKDTKVLEDVMGIVFLMEDTTVGFKKLKIAPAKAEELNNYYLQSIAAGEEKQMVMEVGNENVVQIVRAEVSEDDIFTVVEQPPTYKGGNDALSKYLTTKIKYPAEALKEKISGTVFVSFLVNKTGKVEEPKTIGGVKGGGLEKEAIRLIAAMPDWNPGIQNGKPVKVQYTLPVKFKLP